MPSSHASSISLAQYSSRLETAPTHCTEIPRAKRAICRWARSHQGCDLRETTCYSKRWYLRRLIGNIIPGRQSARRYLPKNHQSSTSRDHKARNTGWNSSLHQVFSLRSYLDLLHEAWSKLMHPHSDPGTRAVFALLLALACTHTHSLSNVLRVKRISHVKLAEGHSERYLRKAGWRRTSDAHDTRNKHLAHYPVA